MNAGADIALGDLRSQQPKNCSEKVDYRPILDECLKGKVPDNLRTLYDVTVRNHVPWLLFPTWAQPQDCVEGCHEG